MINQTKQPFYAIVPAAGVGSRMKADIPKQYLTLHNKTVLEHTVEKLLNHPYIEKVIIAVTKDDPFFPQLKLASDDNVVRVDGGQQRVDSVFSGLDYIVTAISQPEAWVLVHDAARPCIHNSDIDKLIRQAGSSEVGGILASPVSDTIKRSTSITDKTVIDKTAVIDKTIARENLWHALTPQMFRAKPLYDALQAAIKKGLLITDEASAMEAMGLKPMLVKGRSDNFKITQPEDLDLASFYLAIE